MTEQIRKLYRSREDRMLGGVAGGIGEFLDIDPTIIRLIFAFSFFLGGTGVLVYLVMWLIVPEEPLVEVKTARERKASTTSKPPAKKTTAKKSSTTKKS